MTEDINNENVPEENTPKNPTESNSVSGEQTEQATDANPTAAPVLEQAVEGGTANQEIPQQAPVPPTESVAPQGQQTAFEQQVASPFTNPVSPTAPTVTARKELIVLPIISFVVSLHLLHVLVRVPSAVQVAFLVTLETKSCPSAGISCTSSFASQIVQCLLFSPASVQVASLSTT